MAMMLAEKGWENIVLLTGGIKHFGAKYPGCLYGQPPQSWGIETMNRGTTAISPSKHIALSLSLAFCACRTPSLLRISK